VNEMGFELPVSVCPLLNPLQQTNPPTVHPLSLLSHNVA